VVDFDLLWDKEPRKVYFQKELIKRRFSRFFPENNIDIYRPAVIKIPLLDKITIPIFHTLMINRIIKKRNIQLIVGYTILNTFSGLFFSKLHGIPFVYHLIDSINSLAADYLPKPLLFLTRILERIIIKNSDLVITVNKQLRNYAIELGGNPKKVMFFPTGVDFKKYQGKGTRIELRAELGIEKDDLILFFMGWLYEFSGLKELAETLVKGSSPEIRLLVVGDGELLPFLSDLSKKSGKIITTGRVPFEKIPNYLSASDICILPSRTNDIMKHIVPIKIYEYMAAGKPVISTRLPGVVREFGSGKGIFYCNDIEDLLDIARNLKNKGKIEENGALAREYIKKFDWDTLVNQFDSILRDVIKNK
jgi:glycosyltransferase involved in cell wall biosynthesis